MKRYISTLICLFCCIILYAQATKQVSITFNENDFIFTDGDNGVAITSVVHPISFSNDTTAPALPIIPVNVYIEDVYKYDNFSIASIDTLIRENVVIRNCQPVITTNGDTLSYDLISNYSSNIYPATNIKYSGTSIIDGCKIITFLVSPFKYDTENCKLYLIRDLSIEISLTDADYNINETKKRMHNVVRKLVINDQSVEPIVPSVISYDYLIVTNRLMEEQFQKLADWKTMKGVRTKVITVEEIDSLYNDSSLQDKIKRAIQNYYNGEYSGLKYVLLGGDDNIIPVCKTKVRDDKDKIETLSDIFYACLDNLGWKNEMNVGWDLVDENIDISADVVVTRLCVNSEYSARIQTDKIINYESNPNIKDWEDKILMCGVLDTINIYEQGEFTYNSYIAPYWHGTQTRLYDVFTDFPGCENYNVTAFNLKKELEKGYTFVNMDCHGGESASTWALEVDSFYTIDCINYNQEKYTSIMTSSCYSNNFDKDYACLGESFMRQSNSGIIAYIGSSVQGFMGASFFFNQLLYESLLKSDNQQLGDAYFYAKSLFSYMWDKTTNIRNPYSFLYFSINFLGDPETPIYLSHPENFDNVNISYINNTLSIETGVENCKICISSIDNEQYYNIRENISEWILGELNNSYYICITKPGYIPYVARVVNTEYIQNQTIIDDCDIYSNKTFIGNDVTDEQPHGNVVIERGKTTITHNNGVTIKNGFTVKKGAEFKITKN